jgi:hypothetical protein
MYRDQCARCHASALVLLLLTALHVEDFSGEKSFSPAWNLRLLVLLRSLSEGWLGCHPVINGSESSSEVGCILDDGKVFILMQRKFMVILADPIHVTSLPAISISSSINGYHDLLYHCSVSFILRVLLSGNHIHTSLCLI